MTRTHGISVRLPGPIFRVDDITDVLTYDEDLVQQRWESYCNEQESEETQQIEHRLCIIPPAIVDVFYVNDSDVVFASVSRKPQHTFFEGVNDYFSCDFEEGLFAFRGDIRSFRQFFKYIARLVDLGLVKEAIVTPWDLKDTGSGANVDGIKAGKTRVEFEHHIKTLVCVLFLRQGAELNAWMASPVLIDPIRPHLEFRSSSCSCYDTPIDLKLTRREGVVTMANVLMDMAICAADVTLTEDYSRDWNGE
ncbi:hypothetical protein CP532_4472 [Ophiocordyceps camponoti-leonardi (nom. inval.)]|nr:hypothetical protein CP532_4472 [Ophiocordyceps camponoti-leonardi (nom. inval.)]